MNLILLEGEDVYLKIKRLNEIKQKIFKENNLNEGINYFKYQKINVEDLIYQIEMPSFLGGEKLIIIEDETYFKQIETNSKKIIKFLENEENIKNINITLVFFYNQKLRDTNKLKKIFLKSGRIFNIAAPNENEIRKEIINILNKEKVKMEYKEITYFIQSVGNDIYKIINELDKIIRYKKQEKIKENKASSNIQIKIEDIDKIVIKSEDAKMFDITKALEISQNQKAVKIFTENFKNKNEMLGFISYLYTYYFDIYLTKKASSERISPESILNIPPNRRFVINIYKKIAGRLSLNKIKYILKEISRIDRLTKTENTDTYMLIKALLMYI